MTGLQPPPEQLRPPRTRPFTLFTILAAGFAVGGVVTLFSSVKAALPVFGGAALMLALRDILRRSVPPE